MWRPIVTSVETSKPKRGSAGEGHHQHSGHRSFACLESIERCYAAVLSPLFLRCCQHGCSAIIVPTCRTMAMPISAAKKRESTTTPSATTTPLTTTTTTITVAAAAQPLGLLPLLCPWCHWCCLCLCRGSSSGSVGIAVTAAAAAPAAAVAVAEFYHILCRDGPRAFLFVLVLPFAGVLTHLILIPTYLHAGMSSILNRGCYPIQWDKNWSWGLVLCVLAREKLERKYFQFKLTNECWKTFSWHFAFASFV